YGSGQVPWRVADQLRARRSQVPERHLQDGRGREQEPGTCSATGEEGGEVTEERLQRSAQGHSPFWKIRYVLLRTPPVASIALFMRVLSSRVQPHSPPFIPRSRALLTASWMSSRSYPLLRCSGRTPSMTSLALSMIRLRLRRWKMPKGSSRPLKRASTWFRS